MQDVRRVRAEELVEPVMTPTAEKEQAPETTAGSNNQHEGTHVLAVRRTGECGPRLLGILSRRVDTHPRVEAEQIGQNPNILLL